MGGKRPISSMTPLVVLKNGEPYAAVGGSGGSRIVYSVLNVLYRIICEDKLAQDAVNAPRAWARNSDEVDIEQELYDMHNSAFSTKRNYGARQPFHLEPYNTGSFYSKRVQVAMLRDGKLYSGADYKRQKGATGMISQIEPIEPSTFPFWGWVLVGSVAVIVIILLVCHYLQDRALVSFEDETPKDQPML